MIFSFIKTSLRILLKKRAFTFINIGGLAIGMAASLTLFYYVGYEFSYDTFFKDSDRSYRVYFERDQGEQTTNYFYLSTGLKSRLSNASDIEDLFRLINIDYQNNSLIYNKGTEKEVFQQAGLYYADAAIGNFLGLEMIEGSFLGMNEPMKMVLTEQVANRFFPTGGAVGKIIQVSGNVQRQEYEVVGVIKDLPSNTHFNFQVLLSLASWEAARQNDSEAWDNWDNWNAQFYVKSMASESKTKDAIGRETGDYFIEDRESDWKAKIIPLEDFYLVQVEDDGTINRSAEKTLWALVVLGIFIITIAWINFINLSTARAMERSREVGIRKTLGSDKYQLRVQFMVESLIINLLAATLAFTIVQVSIPFLNQLANPMIIPERMQIRFWTCVITLLLCGSLLSGWYPAFILSGFHPAVVLKGKIAKTTSGVSLRKSLVILQFTASAVMIMGTLIVYQQIVFMKNKTLGVNIDNMLILDAPPGALNGGDQSFFQSVNTFKEEVAQLNFVRQMTTSSYIPGEPIGWNMFMRRSQDTEELNKSVMLIASDRDFMATYGLELLAGRFYEEGDDTFGKGSFVINEEALSLFGFKSAEDALGKKLTEGKMLPELTIIGVVKNFHQQSLKNKIRPCGFVLSIWSNYYSLALNIDESLNEERSAQQLKSGIVEVKQVWKKFFPEAPFDYSFLDQKFDQQYKSDQQFGTILGAFTFLALLIASLGLMGLSSYSVAQRTKEIGIRKIMGASVNRLFLLLSKEYFVLTLSASVIAIPLAFYGVTQWLSLYPYRIDVSWWAMLVPIVLILFVALATIAVHTLHAAVKSPVESLRYE